ARPAPGWRPALRGAVVRRDRQMAPGRGSLGHAAIRPAAERFLAAETGEPASGQVLLFQLAGMAEPRHCGILVSPRRFIHAQEHFGVVEADLSEAWARRVAARFRFPEL